MGAIKEEARHKKVSFFLAIKNQDKEVYGIFEVKRGMTS
jgi:hypothetical protein